MSVSMNILGQNCPKYSFWLFNKKKRYLNLTYCHFNGRGVQNFLMHCQILHSKILSTNNKINAGDWLCIDRWTNLSNIRSLNLKVVFIIQLSIILQVLMPKLSTFIVWRSVLQLLDMSLLMAVPSSIILSPSFMSELMIIRLSKIIYIARNVPLF